MKSHLVAEFVNLQDIPTLRCNQAVICQEAHNWSGLLAHFPGAAILQSTGFLLDKGKLFDDLLFQIFCNDSHKICTLCTYAEA